MKANKITIFAGCMATMLLSNATWAQITADTDKASAQDLPTAEKVIADYLAATGGEENHKAIKSIVSSGSLTIIAQGQEIPGELSMKQMAPNMLTLETNVEQMGSQSQGYNGTVAWAVTPQGPEILEGERMQMTQLQADLNQYMHMTDHFDNVECTGEEEFNDEACFVIKATNDDGSVPMTVYFSKESKLLVGSAFTMQIPEAELEIENMISDYRQVGDVKMSFKSTSRNQFFTQVFEMEEIEVNSELTKEAFALPEEVQDLIDQ
jgi:hypothetical protein